MLFADTVTVPIRMHVNAKRYLCAIDPGYIRSLSPASVWSLNLQGGPCDDAEAAEYIKRPFAAEAAKLRRWDEDAKVSVSLRRTWSISAAISKHRCAAELHAKLSGIAATLRRGEVSTSQLRYTWPLRL